jgi:hypothetical protein
MKLTTIWLASALSAALAAPAGAASPFEPLRAADAARAASTIGPSYESKVAMWIWSDKYVYQPGQRLTLRWTVKTNGDLYPYTVVAFRQNNQNGKKYYLPAGDESPTDIFRNSPEQGFQPARLVDTAKGVLIGDGGLFSADAGLIPEEYGMHTIAVQLRDYTGTQVLKTSYMKIGVVREFVDVSGNIESNLTFTSDKAYRFSGVVAVRNNATLTIEPGTFVLGMPGSQPPSVLLITRNGKIRAEGTRSRPIIMTSSLPFGERARGDWGGLILLGRAPVNVDGGEFNIEGLTAGEDTRYGGGDSEHDCGTLAYVRVEYSGSIFAPNNESNSFTWGGCGTKTVAHHLQAVYGLDDSFEWFGGTMNAKYLVGGLGADDYIDFQLGYTGKIQFGVFYQSPEFKGNRGIEGDNSEYNQGASPLSKPKMFNLTFLGSGAAGFDEANSPGIYLRRGAGGEVNNTIVTNFFSAAMFIDGSTTQAQIDNGNITANGLLFWRNNLQNAGASSLDGQVTDAVTRAFAQGQRGNARQVTVLDPMFRRPFELADPDWRGLFGSPLFRTGWIAPPDDGFFDQSAHFIGAFGNQDWTEEWCTFLLESEIKP